MIEAEIQDALHAGANVSQGSEGQGVLDDLVKWAFEAYVSAPNANTPSMVLISTAAIVSAMIKSGYGVHYKKVTSPDDTVKVKVWIGLLAQQGVAGGNINADWSYTVFQDK